MNHDDIVNQNRIAWNSQSYQAWVAAYGTPSQAAVKLMRDPAAKLRRVLPHLGHPQGKKIANPLGSHGRVAVSLALLGAEVNVFDLSVSNKQYAIELAASAKVDIKYTVGDFLEVADQQDEKFDAIVMELGILHYFYDLDHVVRTLWTMLKPEAILVLNEFHPLRRKSVVPEPIRAQQFKVDTFI